MPSLPSTNWVTCRSQARHAEHVGVLGRKAGQFADSRDHLAQCLLRGVVEIRVSCPWRLKCVSGLATRKIDAVSLVQDQSERAGQRRLEGSEIDLAVALHGVAIAGPRTAPFRQTRKCIFGSATSSLLSDVAAVLARLDVLIAP
jgi:hypothetical protein